MGGTDPDDVEPVGCPCGRRRPFDECCGPILTGAAEARTPEDLMRSRYTAFARGDAGHLLRSWAPESRPRTVDIDPALRWTGLDVLDVGIGVVEFRARFVRSGQPGELHERSRFRRHEGRWVYVDGDGAVTAATNRPNPSVSKLIS